MKRLFLASAAASLVVALLAGGLREARAQTPSPAPSASPVPSPTPTEIPGLDNLFPGGRGHGGPHASPSPPVPQRVGIEGVWEIAIQNGANTTYTHLVLHQQQNALTGTYIDARNKHVPIVGTVDGNNVRVVVSYPDGTTVVLMGTLDGTTDMIGMMTTASGQVAFSADYRPKENFFDNLNEQPGGLTNPFPSPPPK